VDLNRPEFREIDGEDFFLPGLSTIVDVLAQRDESTTQRVQLTEYEVPEIPEWTLNNQPRAGTKRAFSSGWGLESPTLLGRC
jgi:hypothetical protein